MNSGTATGSGAKRIVCVGGIVVDRVYRVDEIPPTPQKVVARSFSQRGGGVAATAAVAIAHLGHSAVLWGRLGDDADASSILETLMTHGVKVDAVRRSPGAQTPSSAVIVDKSGDRLLAAFPGVGLEDDPSWLPVEDLGSADAVLADTRWAAGAHKALAMARSAGVPSIVDADVGDPAVIGDMAERADHTIFSEPALRRFAGKTDLEAGLRDAQRLIPGLVGVTMGIGGSCWLEAGELKHQPSFNVKVRDTTGAGDTFHGAYAIAIAEGQAVASAMRFASAAAAVKVRLGQGWDGMPDRLSVADLLR